jgi:hypothetical protein
MRTKAALIVSLLLAVTAVAMAEDGGWPREIPTDKGKLLMYQPQIDLFSGNIVEGRAAMAFTAKGAKEPVFGSFWFKAMLNTDFDTRTAQLVSIQVPKVKFADASEEQQKTVSAFLEREIPKLDIPISIDRLSAAMVEANQEKKGAGDFKNDPPKIVISYEPAVLLFYDGAPILRDIEGQKGVYQQAVNTPLPVVLDVKAKTFFLCGGEIWYAAKDALGPWSPTTAVPEPLLAMKKEADKRQQQQAPQEQQPSQTGAKQPQAQAQPEAPVQKPAGPAPPVQKPAGPAPAKPAEEKPPKVVVATSPTELVVVFGETQWSPIKDTDLLYVSNSLGNIFKDTATQKTYVLLSGRWYEAKSLDGPWAYVAPENLPGGFAKIPEDSPGASVLASVPGTDAAMDALLDAQIPQTATIKRSPVTLNVTYDGDPKFKAIEGTKLEFAVNTSFSVIKLESKYYCCDQAVWYVAAAPKGPWQVADQIPDEIHKIPPSNQNYNVTNVYVFDSTPEAVVTGYYPGYVNSYIYGGCVVYGTGWYYPPYVSPHVYYPFYPTWGFGVGWNPWTGWSVGVSWGYGPFRVMVGFGGYGGYHGWYGPPGYHPPYYGGYPGRPGVPPGHYPPGHYPGGPGGPGGSNRPGGPSVSNPVAGGGGGGGAQAMPSNNIYSSPQNSARNAAAPKDKGAQTANRAGGGANNVYSAPNGDVYRRNNDGSWQQRENGGWSKPTANPSTLAGSGGGAGVSTQPSKGSGAKTSGLQGDAQARSRGNSRTSSYQGSRGGGSRGGGGGRRR